MRRIRHRHDLLLYIRAMQSLPESLREEMLNWPDIVKSPFSRSFYNCKGKRWDFTPEGCLRVSDHWNFRSRRGRKSAAKPGTAHGNAIHCQTDQPVANFTHWTLARFHKGIWHVLQSEPVVRKNRNCRKCRR